MDAPGAPGENPSMEPMYNREARRLQDRFDTRRLADRLDERFVQRPRHRRRRPGVHRADGHVLPRHRRRRGAAAVLVQGRRPRLRAGARRAHARVPELRRQRHVPLDGQRAGQPARRDAVHRLRLGAPVAAARSTASRRSTRTTRCWRPTRRRSSSCACTRDRRSSRTARATSTAWRSWSARGSCRGPSAATPVPDWKRTDWARDVLPAGDPARAES